MDSQTSDIILYGAQRCHKTQYYQLFLEEKKRGFTFLDVEENNSASEDLRNLYKNRKLNFPTITIGKKKLRNPSNIELNKWIEKLK
ncbi:glutaredoxin family protein [Algibacter miyuki]|uniref:Glutaredoxin family protein n=1 Tax=Algibacter miyuki TaxID=1306933 RepID=A0ABV5GZ33_9FLAO|nr:glutaredoxin family protein [Algibacter miyuki]MDN3665982.1 glutaredoxin family protein [Algibacter miyuki]